MLSDDLIRGKVCITTFCSSKVLNPKTETRSP